MLYYHNLTISTYHNIVMLQSHDMLLTRTELHPLCLLRTTLVTVFNVVSDYAYNPERSLHKYMFYKFDHISDPKGFQDIIFSVFDLKFHD